MFNTSNHSSERSMRHGSTRSQRGPSTQKSRSDRSPNSSRHSESFRSHILQPPQRKIPEWVHCEKCFVSHDVNPKMRLLTCLHILCHTCLRINDSEPLSPVTCTLTSCGKTANHRPINSSMDPKLYGMFEQSWMDPILQINLNNLKFMMGKMQSYSRFLSQSIKEAKALSPEWTERSSGVKKTIERIKKMKEYEKNMVEKTEKMKMDAYKSFKNIQKFQSYLQRVKAEANERRQEKAQYQERRGNYQQDMKFVSSGRNEQSNQYIGQLKSSTNHSTANVRHQSLANVRNQNTTNVRNPSLANARNQSANVRNPSSVNVRNQSPNVSNAGSANSRNHITSNVRNHSAPNIENLSQRDTPQTQRGSTSLNQYRDEASRAGSLLGSRRPTMQSAQSATFRPTTSNVRPVNSGFEQQHAQKRLAPSYNYDGYQNPPKRVALHPEPREINLDTSISSVDSSRILNENHRNPTTTYNNRQNIPRRRPTFK